MSTTTNNYTLQPPKTGASTKAVMAERCFIAPANTPYNGDNSDPTARYDGSLSPTGFTDLGIVMGSQVQFSYQKELRYIETGIEKVRRGAYTLGKTAQCSFTLEQYDIDTIALLTGQTIASVGAIGGKMQIGQDDVVERALLFIGTNKIDGKEHHLYCKKGVISWNIEQNDDSRVIKVTADLYPFLASGETVEGYATLYVLD